MTESTSARNAARLAVIENVLADETVASVRSALYGARQAERAIVHQIGQRVVDGDDSAAGDLRDQLYNVQSLRELAERFVAEAEDIQGVS